MTPIRRVGSLFCHGQRDFFGQAAIDTDREEAVETGPAIPGRTKQNALAIPGPADDLVSSGMSGKPLRNSACYRDKIDIFIAVIFPGEGDHRTVGRKVGIGFDPDVTGQVPGFAPTAIDNPEVAAIAERDLCLADPGTAQKSRRISGLAI